MGPQDLRDKRALIVCFKVGAQSKTGITVSGLRMQERFNISFLVRETGNCCNDDITVIKIKK